MNKSQQKEQKEQKIEIGPQHHEIPELSSPANGAILLSMFKDIEFRLENLSEKSKLQKDLEEEHSKSRGKAQSRRD